MQIDLSPVALLVFYSGSCGILLAAIWEALQPGMLLSPLLVRLAKHLTKHAARSVYDSYLIAVRYSKVDADRDLIERAAQIFPILYPLGYCIKCMVPWFAALTFIPILAVPNPLDLLTFPGALVLSLILHIALVSIFARSFIKMFN